MVEANSRPKIEIMVVSATGSTGSSQVQTYEFRRLPNDDPWISIACREERPPDGTIWFFQAKAGNLGESARRLFAELPDDHRIAFVDTRTLAELWVFVIRDGELYFVKRGHGMSPWEVETIDRILECFLASLFASKPIYAIESFVVSSIPEYLREQHLIDLKQCATPWMNLHAT